MSKRTAEVQITSDTADVEEEEERGEFEVASEEQLRARVFKKAKRGRTTQAEGTGLFSGISLSLNGTPSSTTLSSSATSTTTLPAQSTTALSPPRTMDSKYLEQLRSLNVSVSEWIAKHVRDNPFVDLTPIFRDYETHLKNIDNKAPPTTVEAVTHDTNSEEEGEGGVKGEEEEGESSEETGSQLTASESQVSQSEEVDDDSLLSVRAKLFYKKGDSFTELGVGQLRVQQVGSGSSGVRLLLRNDTKLGTILLNVRVTADIPVTVKGNNVFVVCVPNPPLSKEDPSSPVTYLLRVKTAQTASDFLKTLKEH